MNSKTILSRRIRTQLPGSVWIVTGSSRGIGRETARMLVDCGARVVLHGRSSDRLIQLCEQWPADSVTWKTGDIADPATAETLVATAIAVFGRLDGVIANAGVSMRGRFSQLQPEVMQQVVGTNLLGTAYTLQAALPRLRESSGRAVTVSSLAGLRGFPNVSIYSAARMGITGLVESVRAEHSSDPIHLALIALGFTENDPDKEIMQADGSAVRHSRQAASSQQQAAAAIVRAAYSRRWFHVTTTQGHLFRFANRWLPELTGWILRRSGGKLHNSSVQTASSD